MTSMDIASSIHAARDSGAAFRNKVCASAMLAAALPVTVVSLLLGIAPYDVEDTQANFIPCGRMLFHVGPRPSSWCEAVPLFWGVVAEVGLLIGTCMVLAATVFGIRSASPACLPRAYREPRLASGLSTPEGCMRSAPPLAHVRIAVGAADVGATVV